MSKVNRSETFAKVSAAYVKASGMVEIAIKNAVNPHLKNRYADLGAVIDACSAALKANGLAVMQCPVPGDSARLCMETILIHESGEWISSEIQMPVAKQDAQGYGSALTYARRYSLAAMMGVTQDDEDGARASASETESAALDACAAINEAGNMEELKAAFSAAYKIAGSDKSAQKIVTAAKDKRKKELSDGTENG